MCITIFRWWTRSAHGCVLVSTRLPTIGPRGSPPALKKTTVYRHGQAGRDSPLSIFLGWRGCTLINTVKPLLGVNVMGRDASHLAALDTWPHWRCKSAWSHLIAGAHATTLHNNKAMQPLGCNAGIILLCIDCSPGACPMQSAPQRSTAWAIGTILGNDSQISICIGHGLP